MAAPRAFSVPARRCARETREQAGDDPHGQGDDQLDDDGHAGADLLHVAAILHVLGDDEGACYPCSAGETKQWHRMHATHAVRMRTARIRRRLPWQRPSRRLPPTGTRTRFPGASSWVTLELWFTWSAARRAGLKKWSHRCRGLQSHPPWRFPHWRRIAVAAARVLLRAAVNRYSPEVCAGRRRCRFHGVS